MSYPFRGYATRIVFHDLCATHRVRPGEIRRSVVATWTRSNVRLGRQSDSEKARRFPGEEISRRVGSNCRSLRKKKQGFSRHACFAMSWLNRRLFIGIFLDRITGLISEMMFHFRRGGEGRGGEKPASFTTAECYDLLPGHKTRCKKTGKKNSRDVRPSSSRDLADSSRDYAEFDFRRSESRLCSGNVQPLRSSALCHCCVPSANILIDQCAAIRYTAKT